MVAYELNTCLLFDVLTCLHFIIYVGQFPSSLSLLRLETTACFFLFRVCLVVTFVKLTTVSLLAKHSWHKEVASVVYSRVIQ